MSKRREVFLKDLQRSSYLLSGILLHGRSKCPLVFQKSLRSNLLRSNNLNINRDIKTTAVRLNAQAIHQHEQLIDVYSKSDHKQL